MVHRFKKQSMDKNIFEHNEDCPFAYCGVSFGYNVNFQN